MNFLSFGISTQCKNKERVNQDSIGSVTVKSPSGKPVITGAIADGVSMSFRGEVASYNTVRFIMNWAAEYFSENDFDSSQIVTEFDRLITKINHNINYFAKTNNKKAPKEGHSKYSSTTLCCAITDGEKILYFCVGDSSIYELKAYHTSHITGSGKHTDAAGRLTSYIGGIEDGRLDIRYIENYFDQSSVYFLCSDGMSNQISFNLEDADFHRFNQRLLDADAKNNGISVLEGMTEYVLSRNETDDITALVIKSI